MSERLQRLGDKGVLALFSDTVRVEVEGSTPSERVVQETMDRVIREAQGQVIIATFASNISRIHMALVAAEKHGRKVAVAGRSMEQNARGRARARLSRSAGRAADPARRNAPAAQRATGASCSPAARVKRPPRSPGSPPASIRKIRVGEGDIVLVSATPVPGNEETVTRTIDNLFRAGRDVIYSALEQRGPCLGTRRPRRAAQDDRAAQAEVTRCRSTANTGICRSIAISALKPASRRDRFCCRKSAG